MISGRSGWSGWSERFTESGHLALDAVVAFVDEELPAGPAHRAAAHVDRCLTCAAEVAAQRQARRRVRGRGRPVRTELPVQHPVLDPGRRAAARRARGSRRGRGRHARRARAGRAHPDTPDTADVTGAAHERPVPMGSPPHARSARRRELRRRRRRRGPRGVRRPGRRRGHRARHARQRRAAGHAHRGRRSARCPEPPGTPRRLRPRCRAATRARRARPPHRTVPAHPDPFLPRLTGPSPALVARCDGVDAGRAPRLYGGGAMSTTLEPGTLPAHRSGSSGHAVRFVRITRAPR